MIIHESPGKLEMEMVKDRNREELESLLSDTPDMQGKDLYIWGTGNTAELYREGLGRLTDEGFRIKGYCDNNPDKWGQTFDDKEIISPKELETRDSVCVLICSPQKRVVAAVGSQLEHSGIDWYHIDEVIFKTHREDILACYDLLEDLESQKIYKEVIKCRMAGRYPGVEYVNEKQYFAVPSHMGKNPNEVFVDCGAYVGDSIEKYIWERDGGFHKIIAFEPDPGNFAAMVYRVDRLKKEWNIKDEAIELYPYGVGEKSVVGRLERNAGNNGLGSKLAERIWDDKTAADPSGKECRVVALDEFIEEPVTFLKADIESYEYKMLLGARELIKKCRPLVAVCIYHNGVDMYSIPLLLKSMVPEYKMAVRHHSVEMDDTVLYAWIQ